VQEARQTAAQFVGLGEKLGLGLARSQVAFEQQVFAVGDVVIEGGAAHAGAGGNFAERDARDAAGVEHLRGDAKDRIELALTFRGQGGARRFA
jgi:hypothetical protein